MSGPTTQTRAVWLKDLVGAGDELALLDDVADRNVRALVEEFRRREDAHAVALGDVEEAVLGEADAVRDGEIERRREPLHLVGGAVLVAVGDGPDGILAGADEGHDALRADRHVARVRHDGVEIDLEARRQLDLLEVLAQLVGVVVVLRHVAEGRHAGAGRLHVVELFHVVVLGKAGSAGQDKRYHCGRTHQ